MGSLARTSFATPLVVAIVIVICYPIAACHLSPPTGDEEDSGEVTECMTLPGEFSCNVQLRCTAEVACTLDSTIPPTGDPACVIAQLLAPTPSFVRIQYVPTPDSGGFCGGTDDIYIVGDGTAVLKSSPIELDGPSLRVEIRDASFFDPCLTPNAEPTALNDCLTKWDVANTCIAPVCCPGGNGESKSVACEST